MNPHRPNRIAPHDPELEEFTGVIDALKKNAAHIEPRKELLSEILSKIGDTATAAQSKTSLPWIRVAMALPLGVGAVVVILAFLLFPPKSNVGSPLAPTSFPAATQESPAALEPGTVATTKLEPTTPRSDTSSFSAPALAPQVPEANIRVTAPQPNEEVSLPLVIRGEARVFESVFAYRLRDADGSILFEGHAMANAPDTGQFGPFEISVTYLEPSGTSGILEVFSRSAKDGSEINRVAIPVRFKK